MQLPLAHSLKAKLEAGLMAAWVMTLALASVLYFGAQTSEQSARVAAGADDEVLELLGFALVTHRYIDAFGQSLAQQSLGANDERHRAEQLFEARIASIPVHSGAVAHATVDWPALRAISTTLHDELETAGALRAAGNADAAARTFSRAKHTQFEQRMLPWFDRALEVQRAYADRLERSTINHMRALRQLGNLLAGGLALLTALVLWATMRALLRPIGLLVDGTAAIARGDYSHRIRYQSKDEFGLLARRFDDMAATVESSQQSLVNKNRDLEQAYQLQGQFLSVMSHELRSPLHSILGYTELVLDDTPAAAGSARRNLGSIATSAHRLLALINDILDFSKLKAGRMALRSERFAIAQLAEEAVDDARVLAQRSAVDVVLEIEPGISEMVSDPIKVRQILTNLLSNAVKFCEHGSVSLRVERQGSDQLVFRVRDTGVGIPPDQLTQIFEPFRQLHGADPRTEGGTGLGLAIVSRLGELLGGRVAVESRVGVGSEFAVWLPVRAEGEHGKDTDRR
jgi:signal transduction histidine kinase